MSRFSAHWFAATFALAYTVLLVLDLPLFHYYPLTGTLSWHPLPEEFGPSMHWYGLLAGAGIAACGAAWVLKDGYLPVTVRYWIWLAPAAAMAACLYVLRGFFGVS
ncbi:MAG: hypothetical protein WCY11_02030 [Novosphingobium sp.]